MVLQSQSAKEEFKPKIKTISGISPTICHNLPKRNLNREERNGKVDRRIWSQSAKEEFKHPFISF